MSAIASRFRAARAWVGRDHGMSLVGVAAENVLGLMGSVFVARLLSPDARGDLARWVYWSGVALGVGTLGMTSALPQLVGAGRFSIDAARRLLPALAVVLALVAITAGTALAPAACPTGPCPTGWKWMLYSGVPGGVLAALGAGALVAASRIRVLMVTRTLAAVGRVVAITALLILGAHDATATAIAFALPMAAAGIALLAAARPSLRAPERGPLLAALGRGAAVHAPALAAIGLTMANQGWVYSRLPSDAGGLYAVAAGAAATLQVLSLAELTASTVPMAHPQSGWRAVRTALWRTSSWSAAGVVAGAVAAPIAVPLIYGAPYAPAVVPFCILLAANGAENLARVGQSALQSRGHPKTAWVIDVVRAATLGACMLGFAIRGGIAAVAWATLASQAAGAGVALLLLRSARRRSSVVASNGP